MNNTTSLTTIIKDLYTQNTEITVKEILSKISSDYTNFQTDYRKVYNTLKRINGSTKTQKTSKMEKSTVIFDLSAPPAATVKGIVVKRGRRN